MGVTIGNLDVDLTAQIIYLLKRMRMRWRGESTSVKYMGGLGGGGRGGRWRGVVRYRYHCRFNGLRGLRFDCKGGGGYQQLKRSRPQRIEQSIEKNGAPLQERARKCEFGSGDPNFRISNSALEMKVAVYAMVSCNWFLSAKLNEGTIRPRVKV